MILSDKPYIDRHFYELNQTERKQLIELFRNYGLIGNAKAVHNPSDFAAGLEGEPVAVAVCRILNDFRPLENIVESLWKETLADYRLPYLCSALSMECHASGLRYSILQKIAGQAISLNILFDKEVPLGLTANPENDEFVVPLNAVYADRILQRACAREGQYMFDAFKGISKGLAPYVNRLAVKMKTPEARLAGRLLDADKIVKPLLGARANELYEVCSHDWAWNSRFWEQRALLVAGTDLPTALQYARHAVAIEEHPFTLTTLGKLLFQQMEGLNQETESVFTEAFEKLTIAINTEGFRSRITVHPFSTLLHGTVRYLELGGNLKRFQREKLKEHMGGADYYFGNDPVVQQWLIRLEKLI